MTFGKWIAATAVGGMEDYLSAYPRSLLLRALDPASVADTLRRLTGMLAEPGGAPEWRDAFSWREITAALLPKLEERLSRGR